MKAQEGSESEHDNQCLQLCKNAVRTTQSAEIAHFWRLLTSSRQSRASQGCRYSDLAFALRVCKQHQDNGGGDGDTTTPRHKLPRVSSRHRLPRYRSRISSLFSFYISILSFGRHIYDIYNYIYLYICIPTAI